MAKKTKRKKKDMSLDDFFRMRLEAAFVSSAKPKPKRGFVRIDRESCPGDVVRVPVVSPLEP